MFLFCLSSQDLSVLNGSHSRSGQSDLALKELKGSGPGWALG